MDKGYKLTLREAAALILIHPPENWMEALWLTYKSLVVPTDAGHTQITECKRAFFGGARALFELQTGVLTELPDDECEKQMSRLQEELSAFGSNPF